MIPSMFTAKLKVLEKLPMFDKKEYNRAWKAAHRQDVKKSERARVKRKNAMRPFEGCDGEGCGVDALGRQHYMLLRMGPRELFTGQPLTTLECLNFICDHPPGSILVGFVFGYDTTMILRDLPPERQKRLFMPRMFRDGHSPYTWFHEFDIDYLPKNFLRVRRVKLVEVDGREYRVPIKGSERTIYETFGFFQKGFLETLKTFEIASKADLDIIDANKMGRAGFTEITPAIRHYCDLECQYLAQLMEDFRDNCNSADIKPRTWSGAGKLAEALHVRENTPTKMELIATVPKDVEAMANLAYYGGRFEITRVGKLKGPIWEYDINSAYPAAMGELPCLIHGHWDKFDKQPSDPSGLYVANVKFKAAPWKNLTTGEIDNAGQLCGFPIRSKEGHLYFPLQGSGTYWSCEVRSAQKLGHKVSFHGGYEYWTDCKCHQFGWVENLYEVRKSMGAQGAGYPLKLGLASLYGKTAQRKGNPRFSNMIWAGLITAQTRSKLNEAIAFANTFPRGSDPAGSTHGGNIVMIATDAVYSMVELPGLKTGDRLGQWENKTMDGMFIVQPGLYWDYTKAPPTKENKIKRRQKSRGLSGRFFEMTTSTGQLVTDIFQETWRDFQALENSGLNENLSFFPKVSVPVRNFIGLKLAVSRGKPETAGCWIDEERTLNFDYRNKRMGHVWEDDAMNTKPRSGDFNLTSLPHDDFIRSGGSEAWDAARLALEDQPDYVDLGPPWQDL
jgi:hypothetical protein